MNNNNVLEKKISIRISKEHERMFDQLLKEDITPSLLIRYYLDQAGERLKLINKADTQHQ